MSGLGETLSGNESGTVDSFVPTQVDVRQNDKSQISQTTSNESLSHVISRDYIYKATYAIDGAMKPGHIFGLIRIHPYDCNKYVAHVAQMFKTWTGGMKVRARFMANFANGGSFRIGFLPPIFTQADIQSIPLDTLTGYPNQDLDPKNTDWTEFKTSDQRNVAYHYMKDPSTDPDVQDIGGWIVFYVVGSLVQALQATGGVQMVVETAGDFDFRQLSPLGASPLPPTLQGPLSESSILNLLSQPGCDDRLSSQGALQVCADDITQVGGGFVLARGLDGKLASTQPNTVLSTYITYWQGRIDSGAAKPSLVTPVTQSMNFPNVGSHFSDSGQLPVLNIGASDGTDLVIWGLTGDGDSAYYLSPDAITSNTEWHSTATGNTMQPQRNGAIVTVSSLEHGAVSTKMSPFVGVNTFHNERPGESILLFVSLVARTFNTQTFLMAESLRTNPAIAGTDYLYTLRSSETPGILMYVRLQQNGMFTTTRSPTSVVLAGQNYYLSYEGELSPSAPLPTAQATHSVLSAWHKIAGKALKHGLSIGMARAKYLPFERI